MLWVLASLHLVTNALMYTYSVFSELDCIKLHSQIWQARDIPRILQVLYALIPYFIFSPQEGCRSSLFSATDPQIPEYWETLKSDDWPVCPFISQDCRPANPSEEAHNTETARRVWEKTLELVGLPTDAVEKLIEGENVECRYDAQHE